VAGTTKKFAFVSDAAEREFKSLPAAVCAEFGKSLRAVQQHKITLRIGL
jgi:hypothetical protein